MKTNIFYAMNEIDDKYILEAAQCLLASHNHAADRNRTGTGITTHGILSPGRLPVPPLRHMEPIGLEPMTLCL